MHSLAVVLCSAGVFAAVPGIGASGSTGFVAAQQRLEQQLSTRASELARLAADVAGSRTLAAGHAKVLGARIATERASIGALASKVPADTTYAELASDRNAMLRDNRVYAVEAPQVFDVIGADAVAAQVLVLGADEPALAVAVASLAGQPGYAGALARNRAYVSTLARVSASTAHLVAAALAQTPQSWPRDAHLFASANRQLLAANVALAHASFDAGVIGLAAGGYTGS